MENEFYIPDSKEDPYLKRKVPILKLCKHHFDFGIRRNLRWINKIINNHFSLECPVLFAMGMNHLLGATGILELLKRYGSEISRINLLGEPITYISPAEQPDAQLLMDIHQAVIDYTEEAVTLSTKPSDDIALDELNMRKKSSENSKLVLEYMGPMFFQHPKFLSEHIDVKLSEDLRTSVSISDAPIHIKFST